MEESSVSPSFHLSSSQILSLVQVINNLSNSGYDQNDERFKTLLKILKSQDLSFLKENQKISQSNLSPDQLNTLRLEITSYRKLSRNIPLDKSVIEHISSKKQNFDTNGINSYKPNYPLDLLLQAKQEARLRELQMLPRNLPISIKTQTDIELSKLRLLRKQQQIRNDIAHELRCSVALHTSDSDTSYRRQKLKDETEELIPFKLHQDKQNSKMHQQYLLDVINHVKAFKEFHSSFAQKIKRLNRTLVTYHTSKARREQQLKEKQEKERLRLLKENDEVAYLELLEKTKNERLTQLLKQTDEYLSQIGALVIKAKEKDDSEKKIENNNIKLVSDNKNDVNLNEMTEEEKKQLFETEKEEAKQLQSTKMYYTTAHTIKETIHKQPDCLIGGTLKRYQMKGLQWLVSLYNNNLNGVLADEMGLGKTIQTIALLTYLKEKKGCTGPFLIVVPLSVLSNWKSELEQWAPSLITIVYKGSPKTRKDLYQQSMLNGVYNVVITTFDFVMRDKKYLSKVEWNYIIVDEGHRMKNSQSKLTTTMSKYYKSRHRLLLTGTPLQNSIPELWSLLNFLLPTIFNSVDNFEIWFSAPFVAAGECAEMNEEESLLIIHRLHKVLRPFLLRRLKIEVEDQLPAKVEHVFTCEQSAMQKKLYGIIEGKIIASNNKNQNFSFMNTLMQLRKLCNHPYLFSPNGEYIINEDLIRSSGKLVLLDNILPKLKAAGHRVLIFSQMTALLTILGYYLDYRGYKFLRLDGATKSDDRTEYMLQFNAPNSDYFVFILSTRAGGLGLNLQTADTVILFDSDWNPQMDLQAQDRAHRIGQPNEVRVFRFITVGDNCKTVEEDILARANHKLDVDKKIIQAGMFNNNSSASERRQYLMELLQGSQSANKNNKILDPQTINKLLARSDDEFTLYQKMDIEKEIQRKENWILRGNIGSPPPLLMTESELPDWVKIDLTVPETVAIEYGRGKRFRDDINYGDISDYRFNKILKTGIDPGNRKRKRNDLKIESEEDLLQESVFGAIEDESTEDDTEDDEIDDYPLRKKQKITSINKQEQINSLFTSILDEMESSFDKGRQRCELFMVLPSPTEYPDYYLIIKKPIDITTIRRRIERDHYHTIDDFKNDINTLVTNAQTYNQIGSQVYKDAEHLKNICADKLRLFSF